MIIVKEVEDTQGKKRKKKKKRNPSGHPKSAGEVVHHMGFNGGKKGEGGQIQSDMEERSRSTSHPPKYLEYLEERHTNQMPKCPHPPRCPCLALAPNSKTFLPHAVDVRSHPPFHFFNQPRPHIIYSAPDPHIRSYPSPSPPTHTTHHKE